MLLLIMNIPGQVGKRELADFINSAHRGLLRWLPLPNKPTLKRCEIVRIDDRSSGTVEYHGLVSIHPLEASHRTMERLNGMHFLGRRVVVKPYCKRVHYKDRRRSHADLDQLPQERRRGDRRRPALVTHRLCRQ